MARRPRIDIPHLPQHLVQRGNNRQRCFFDDHDRYRYLHDLRALARHHECAVHAFVLMDNHVHLLVTPEATGRVASLMQALSGGHARALNGRWGRTGALWEGRYRSSPVDSVGYLLRCYRYIELNPVRAAMVADPQDHAWSSYGANAFGEADPLVTPHREYLRLDADDAIRLAAYRALVAEGVADAELALIRRCLRSQHALGDERFRRLVETHTGRPAGPLPAGRPSRRPEAPVDGSARRSK